MKNFHIQSSIFDLSIYKQLFFWFFFEWMRKKFFHYFSENVFFPSLILFWLATFCCFLCCCWWWWWYPLLWWWILKICMYVCECVCVCSNENFIKIILSIQYNFIFQPSLSTSVCFVFCIRIFYVLFSLFWPFNFVYIENDHDDVDVTIVNKGNKTKKKIIEYMHHFYFGYGKKCFKCVMLYHHQKHQ